jgi:chaperonin GroEL
MITGDESKLKLIAGVNALANAVKVTLGPYGKTVILHDEKDTPYNTKDGVSVANAISLEDPYENIACKMLKEVAKKTADEAGDGTTTSTVLAQAFINEGFKFLNDGNTYNDLKDVFNKCLPSIIDKLKKSSRIITKDNVVDVATISANNDRKIGELIQMAFTYSSIVKVEAGDDIEDKISYIEGSEYFTTYFDKRFITNEGKNTSELINPSVMLLDGKLSDMSNIKSVLTHCNKTKQPLVIITEHITDDLLKLLITNQINGSLQLLPIKTPGFAQYRKEYINDIKALTGANIVDANSVVSVKDLGSLKSIIASQSSTLMISNDMEPVYKRLETLKSLLDTDMEDYSKTVLKDRINNLMGEVSIIKVGGKSEIEMKERFDRVEDAVLAVSSALEEGVVQGGGMTLYKIANDRVYPRLINNVLKAPTKTIIKNGASSNIINDLSESVIDPVKVTRCALENAASIALTMLGTEVIILNKPSW